MSCERAEKRQKTMEKQTIHVAAPHKKIATHDGVFHCDESLSCAMLRMLPAYKDAEVVRTRDKAKIAECDIVVDVGDVYDHNKLRYDHHQRGFAEVFGHGRQTKMSSAGLVYRHYGKQLIMLITECSEQEADMMYPRVYSQFVEAVDGNDNGIPASAGPLNYRVGTSLADRVSRLNLEWNDKRLNDPEAKVKAEKAQFSRAMQLAGSEFADYVSYCARVWLPARALVRHAIDKRLETHPSGQIICLSEYCKWPDHLVALEKELHLAQPILFVLHPDKQGYRVHAVNKEEGSFELRKPLPKRWCGLRDSALSQAVGKEGATFVHIAGFTGGHSTYEGALFMASEALKE